MAVTAPGDGPDEARPPEAALVGHEHLLNHRTGEQRLRRVPVLDNEIAFGDMRLMLLPPGDVDIHTDFDTATIDVNFNANLVDFACNSDAVRTTAIPPNHIAFWPVGTEVWLRTTNTLPGCILEIGAATLSDWQAWEPVRSVPSEAAVEYRPDPIGSAIAQSALWFLARDANSLGPTDRLTAEALALALGTRAFSQFLSDDADPNTLRARARSLVDRRRIARAVEWVETHVSDPDLSISDMAAAAHLSSSQFSSVFKVATGESPYAFVLRRRAAFAQTLVIGTTTSLAEVAYAAGFASQAHMTSVYKRFYGTTPGTARP